MTSKMDLDEWLAHGVAEGFCTEVYCDTHDGWAREDGAFLSSLWEVYEGDHCWFVVRIKHEDKDSHPPGDACEVDPDDSSGRDRPVIDGDLPI